MNDENAKYSEDPSRRETDSPIAWKKDPNYVAPEKPLVKSVKITSVADGLAKMEAFFSKKQ